MKTGLPGMAYVQLDPHAEWPPELQVRLPPEPARMTDTPPAPPVASLRDVSLRYGATHALDAVTPRHAGRRAWSG